MNSDTTDPPYVVLGDVIQSRDLADRSAFQRRLYEALETVNERFRVAIPNDFDTIKGVDEFGGTLEELSPVYEVMATILDRVHPTTIRFGIAQGPIDIGSEGDPISKLDGPAFHTAGELLEAAERDDLYAGVDTCRPVDPLLASTLNTLLLQREELTERQVEVVRAYEREGTQTSAAKTLDVPQQSISRTLQRANYQRLAAIREGVRRGVANVYD